MLQFQGRHGDELSDIFSQLVDVSYLLPNSEDGSADFVAFNCSFQGPHLGSKEGINGFLVND